ncbi:hypothetical protein EV1_015020 [Malus domestica]
MCTLVIQLLRSQVLASPHESLAET